jgi:hypothetical protein
MIELIEPLGAGRRASATIYIGLVESHCRFRYCLPVGSARVYYRGENQGDGVG